MTKPGYVQLNLEIHESALAEAIVLCDALGVPLDRFVSSSVMHFMMWIGQNVENKEGAPLPPALRQFFNLTMERN